ncbi:hypothetical protein LJC56_11775 [Christensenellaceae bacterium OttesenSCG-928-K19]|nr:hypothetical protein [Christensenellaceae bacterium OttesenSCG-928-K19]
MRLEKKYWKSSERIDYEYHIVNGRRVLLEVSVGNEAMQDVLYDNYA